MPHRATNAMNRSRSRRERVALSAVLGCSGLAQAYSLASWQPTRQPIRSPDAHQSHIRRDTTPLYNLVNQPVGTSFDGVPAGFEDSVVRTALNVSSRNRIRRKKASDSANSTGKVRSSRRYSFAPTKLFYRNGNESDCIDSSTGNRIVLVRSMAFTWCRKALGKDQSQDDLDRYLKFLDHRYNRLHDENFCYDDRLPKGKNSRRKGEKCEDVYSALGLTELAAARSNNIVSSPSSTVNAGRNVSNHLHNREATGARILLSASALPTAFLKTDVFKAGCVMLKRIQEQHFPLVSMRKKLASTHVVALSALAVSWISSLRDHVRGEILRSLRTFFGAVVGVVCFFLRPLPELTL